VKLILVIAAIIQACVLYLLVGFGVNALWAKMDGYENWKEWYREEDGSYILSLIAWPIMAVLIVVWLPVVLIQKVLDDLSRRK
jgi:succinate dehydrogenase/fumarate reductase cytochrome b subunit